MKNKIILIFTAYVSLFVLGLVSCGDDCDGPFYSKYKTIGLDWHNYRVNYAPNSNTNLILREIEGNAVLYNEYSIFIKPEQVFYANQNSTGRKFDLVHAAYACDPVVIATTVEKIDSIVISSAKDFNESHRAGANLSDLFDVVVRDNSNNYSKKNYNLNDYLALKPLVPNELTLILKEQPQATTDFEFLVKFYQKGVDKSYFEFLTNRIVIQRN
jgi:hypothetical protein